MAQNPNNRTDHGTQRVFQRTKREALIRKPSELCHVQSEGEAEEPLDRREQRRADRQAVRAARDAARNARERKEDVRCKAPFLPGAVSKMQCLFEVHCVTAWAP